MALNSNDASPDDIWNQDKRLLRMTAPALSGHKVALTELDGVDEISKPFLFKIRFVTTAPAKAVRDMLRTEVTLEFGLPDADNKLRRFRGLVRRVTRVAFAQDGIGTSDWQAEVVPPLWFLSLKTDVKIFQDVTLKDIINRAMQEAGFRAPKITATGFASHKFEYCVQYNETTLDFISRLMEKFGWFYYHDHTEAGSTLVIADMNAQVRPWNSAALAFGSTLGEASMVRLDEDYSVLPGQWTSRDFDYNTFAHEEHGHPSRIKSPGVVSGDERYGYPAAILEKSKNEGQAGLYPLGRDLTNVVAERDEARHHLRHGESDAGEIDAGRRVRLEGAGLESPEVLVVSVHHSAKDYSHWTSEEAGEGQQVELFYRNEFTCLPQNVSFRPEARTPQPVVRGPQTATVTGSGEIDTDRFGRVKVHFHWDRNPGFTCWIRVSQGWAGNGFGHIQIPRVGEEVIVDFLEGNPDRPIITGRVYNGKNAVPYGLPANKTQSGIKTRSSPGGGSDNFNELRFEDKKGSEQIFVHAEKDLDTEVENNETRTVGQGGTGNRTSKIKNNETLTVGGNKKTDVTGNFDETITGKETRTVIGAVEEKFMSTEKRTVIGAFEETIMATSKQTVMGGLTFFTPATINCTAIGGITFTAPGGFTVVAPGGTKTIDNFFEKIGNINRDSFGLAVAVNMTKMDINNFAMAKVNVKVERVDAAAAKVGMAYNDVGMEVSKAEFIMENGSTAIHRAAMRLLL